MYSLTHATRLLGEDMFAPGSDGSNRTYLEEEVVRAAMHHITTSHITRTWDTGSSGRKEVTWSAEEQCFIDWGNNFRLFGPDSHRGSGKWVLHARHDNEVIVSAILDRARYASKMDQVQKIWGLYWQLLLNDLLKDSAECTFDLHLRPLDVSRLAPKPIYTRPPAKREPDYLFGKQVCVDEENSL